MTKDLIEKLHNRTKDRIANIRFFYISYQDENLLFFVLMDATGHTTKAFDRQSKPFKYEWKMYYVYYPKRKSEDSYVRKNYVNSRLNKRWNVRV